MSEFEQWFGGSKYTQVVYPNQKTKRIALDGWNAALSVLQVEQAAKIAEIEAKLAEVEKDAERYLAIKKNVEEVLVSPRTTHLDEYGLVDIRMKWQIKPTLISYTCVGENISFDEASDMLVAAIQESKKGIV